MEEKETIKHPSYGMVQFSRVQSNSKDRFFGSDLKIDHHITLTIRKGEVQRHLNNDWYHAQNRFPLIEVRLTPNQFAELITSMNYNSGVPCTIDYIDGKKIEPDESFINKKDLHHKEFKEEIGKFDAGLIDLMNKVIAVTKKQTLNKQDKEDIVNGIKHIVTEIRSNIPFYLEQFQEAMDKVVLEAKTELDSAITQKITNLGLQALQLQSSEEANKLLDSPNNSL